MQKIECRDDSGHFLPPSRIGMRVSAALQEYRKTGLEPIILLVNRDLYAWLHTSLGKPETGEANPRFWGVPVRCSSALDMDAVLV